MINDLTLHVEVSPATYLQDRLPLRSNHPIDPESLSGLLCHMQQKSPADRGDSESANKRMKSLNGTLWKKGRVLVIDRATTTYLQCSLSLMAHRQDIP